MERFGNGTTYVSIVYLQMPADNSTCFLVQHKILLLTILRSLKDVILPFKLRLTGNTRKHRQTRGDESLRHKFRTCITPEIKSKILPSITQIRTNLLTP